MACVYGMVACEERVVLCELWCQMCVCGVRAGVCVCVVCVVCVQVCVRT